MPKPELRLLGEDEESGPETGISAFYSLGSDLECRRQEAIWKARVNAMEAGRKNDWIGLMSAPVEAYKKGATDDPLDKIGPPGSKERQRYDDYRLR